MALGLRHRVGIALQDLSGRQLLEKSYREQWHGWSPIMKGPLGAVRVDRTEARGYVDTGDDLLGVAIRFRRVDGRWCHDKAGSILNTFQQPDPMRAAMEQFGRTEGKSLVQMLEGSIPGDSVWPIEVDSTIWEPLLPRHD